MYLSLSNYLDVAGNAELPRSELLRTINYLIVHDFEKLVSILYRMDVSEKKIQVLLANFPETDAAEIILKLMEEREAEKKISREQFKQKDTGDGQESDLEKW